MFCDRMFRIRILSIFVRGENVSLSPASRRIPPRVPKRRDSPSRSGRPIGPALVIVMLAARAQHDLGRHEAPAQPEETDSGPFEGAPASPRKIFRFEVTLDPVLCTYDIEARCQNLIMLRAARKG